MASTFGKTLIERGWVIGLAITVAVLGVSTARVLAPQSTDYRLISAKIDLEEVPTRMEAWLACPLRYATTFDAQAMRDFIEGKQALEADLETIAGHSAELGTAVSGVVEIIRVANDKATGLTYATPSEQEAAARAFVAQADEVRARVNEIVALAEQHDATVHVEGDRIRQLTTQVMVISIVMSIFWTIIGIRRWQRTTARRFGRLAAVAGGMADALSVDDAREATYTMVNQVVSDLAACYRQLRESSEFHMQRQENLRNFTEALETTDDESELLALLRRMLITRHPGRNVQVLLTDPSEAHLETAFSESHDHCRCDPSVPPRCKVLRLGRVLRVDDPDSVAACPRMMQDEPHPYACIPLTVAGRTSAALRIVGTADEPMGMDDVLDVATVAQRFAVRLGVLRLLVKTSRQARTDPLTGLFNRRVMMDTLNKLVSGVGLRGQPPLVAVLGLDLDRFKKLNDTYGHAAGDTALRTFTSSVKQVLPESAVFGRMGGEEFAVFVPVRTVAEGMDVGWQVVQVARDNVAKGTAPNTTCSVGVAFVPTDSHDPQTIIQIADERLYIAKESGRNRAVGPEEHATLSALAKPRLQAVHGVDPGDDPESAAEALSLAEGAYANANG